MVLTMDLVMAIAVLITRVFSPAVTDGLVPVAPRGQARVYVVLIGVDQRTRRDAAGDDGFDGPLLDIGQHADHHLTATLDHAEDRWFLLLQGAASPLPPEPSPPPGAAFF